MRKKKICHVAIVVTVEMMSAGAEIIDSFDCAYESSLDAAMRVFLAMLEAQKVRRRGRGNAPRKVDATTGDLVT